MPSRALLLLLAAALGASLPAGADALLKELNQRGLQHLERKEFGESVRLFEAALRRAPDHRTLHRNLAYALAGWGVAAIDANQIKPAIERLRRAIEHHRKDLSFNVWLGVAYYRQRAYFDATVELRFVLARDPARGKAWEYLGYCYYQRNRLAKAIEAWERAKALAPDDANLTHWLTKARREAKLEKGFTRQQSSHFLLIYDDRTAGAGDAAAIVSRQLEDAYRVVGSALGVYPDAVISVILYPQKTFHEATGTGHWVGGLYDGKIRLPVGQLTRATPRLTQVIRHEFAHALVAQLTASCPRWLNEGLAQLVEPGTAAKAKARVDAAQRAGRLFPIARLAGPFDQLGTPERIRLGYAQSVRFVQYLDRLRGKRSVADLLRRLGKGEALDAACQAIYRRNLSQLEADWRALLVAER